MVRERVMVLNICSWIGVSACGCCCWVASELDGGLAGGGGWAGAGWGTSRAAASLWTSSFRTRPSFPVPVTSAMLTSSSFKSPRTAGVAKDECCLDIGPLASPSVSPTLTAFSTCCSAFFCGGCADGEEPACSAVGVVRASSSGEISLWMSISHSGYRYSAG